MKRNEEILAIPGDGGFWKASSAEEFIEVGKELGRAGLSDDQIVDILTRLYRATANCYGD